MNHPHFSPTEPLDLLAIEAEARRMRAEAAADLARSLARWIAARLGRRSGPVARGA
ncbi:MAG: RSP_7527 family protein [Gemmobacter sp.]